MIFFYVVVSVIVLSILVTIHEFGHFIVAKLSGTKVNEFAVGFGPKIFSKKYGETEYSFRLMLFGGFCALAGEDETSNDKRAVTNQPWYTRLGIFAAGPLMNILLTFILLVIVFYIVGSPVPIVGSVLSGYPAEKAGIIPGDKIVMVNNTKINDWDTLQNIINSNSGIKLKFTIERDNVILTKSIVPTYDKNASKPMIGIVPQYKRSLLLAFSTGTKQAIFFSKMIILSLYMLITGKVSANDLMGPVGIVQAIGSEAKSGILNLMTFAALISVNLGLFNLLPFPALDGGRILFVLIEKIRGKPVDPEKEGFVHYIGFILLIALMIFATYRDLIRINIFK
ncbi:RIP metalloprotease RseP [Thermoanaerobacterium thermosaccharolyticum]|uniref:RIP metalloprotease RseP n=1 Tax=Thermoanaerobacterium thermosaccharolyticum TaxID=1517 RepID=UPI000C0721D2|nr:RIP metalloprotease RseP [Thermoanaerobacterium thermosaccharolyticum]PHO07733.1 RIP metalloprotease RseP [Thermoanaerobacterium thermosaccharolyticum]